MVDYRKMYFILCRAASRALDLLPESDENRPGRAVLQEALYEAEDVFLDGEDPYLRDYREQFFDMIYHNDFSDDLE